MKKYSFSFLILFVLASFLACSKNSSNSFGSSHQTESCKKYVACYKAIFGGSSVETMFGADAPCWKAGELNVKTCDEGCKNGLDLLKKDPKFQETEICK